MLRKRPHHDLPDAGTHHARSSPERRLNLLIVSSSLWIGGAETVIAHLARTIDRSRFNVTVCYLKDRGHIGDELLREGVDVIGTSDGADNKVNYLSFRGLWRVIRARNIDVVHTHTVDGVADAAICKLLSPRLKFVHTFHFGNYPGAAWYLVRSNPTIRPRLMWMERVFASFADRLCAVGEAQRQQLRCVYRFRERSIQTIWNGVPIPADGADASFRTRLDLGGRILIGTIATLIEQKGLRDLLKVARLIADRHGDKVRFVIVGEGRLRPELEALRRNLGLDGVVHFTGWVPNAATAALPSFDVFFQPSLWEAMSVVILEAMASKRAIVATRVGENSLIIDHGTDGLLVLPQDINGMVAALDRVITDSRLRQRLGEAARRKVEHQFTLERMAHAYEQIYLELSR